MEQISDETFEPVSIPLSLGIAAGEFVFASGQGPNDPETGDIVSADVHEQTVQTLENVGQVLDSAGVSLDDVVKVTAFLTDADYYEEFNAAYREVMDEPFPARSVVVTGIVQDGQKVEIEAIAHDEQAGPR